MSTTVNRNLANGSFRSPYKPDQKTQTPVKDTYDHTTSPRFDSDDDDDQFDYRTTTSDKYLTPTKYRLEQARNAAMNQSNKDVDKQRNRTNSGYSVHNDGTSNYGDRILIPTKFKHLEKPLDPSHIPSHDDDDDDDDDDENFNRRQTSSGHSSRQISRDQSVRPFPSPAKPSPDVRGQHQQQPPKNHVSSNGSHRPPTPTRTKPSPQRSSSNSSENGRPPKNPSPIRSIDQKNSNSGKSRPSERLVSSAGEDMKPGRPYRISGQIEFVEKPSRQPPSTDGNAEGERDVIFKGTVRGFHLQEKPNSSTVPNPSVTPEGDHTLGFDPRKSTIRHSSTSSQSTQVNGSTTQATRPSQPTIPTQSVIPTPPHEIRRRTYDFGVQRTNSQTEDDDFDDVNLRRQQQQSSRPDNMRTERSPLKNAVNSNLSNTNRNYSQTASNGHSSLEGQYSVKQNEEKSNRNPNARSSSYQSNERNRNVTETDRSRNNDNQVQNTKGNRSQSNYSNQSLGNKARTKHDDDDDDSDSDPPRPERMSATRRSVVDPPLYDNIDSEDRLSVRNSYQPRQTNPSRTQHDSDDDDDDDPDHNDAYPVRGRESRANTDRDTSKTVPKGITALLQGNPMKPQRLENTNGASSAKPSGKTKPVPPNTKAKAENGKSDSKKKSKK